MTNNLGTMLEIVMTDKCRTVLRQRPGNDTIICDQRQN